MARADYCGNGQSHTHQDTTIDMYDRLGMIQRTTEASEEWDPAKAAFEAAWAPDGATCLARTRDGRALETILQECPNRFQKGAVAELDGGERCTVRRVDVHPGSALLRNLSAMREKIKVLERAVKVLWSEQAGQSSRDASALTSPLTRSS